LKGSAANLGALRVAEVALELEQLAEREALDESGEVLDDLVTALAEAAAALDGYQLDAASADEAWSA
jgi:HPt (histidine-containing phosphotransfer) domain-containing protein